VNIIIVCFSNRPGAAVSVAEDLLVTLPGNKQEDQKFNPPLFQIFYFSTGFQV
jgi:hypothetical protein